MSKFQRGNWIKWLSPNGNLGDESGTRRGICGQEASNPIVKTCGKLRENRGKSAVPSPNLSKPQGATLLHTGHTGHHQARKVDKQKAIMETLRKITKNYEIARTLQTSIPPSPWWNNCPSAHKCCLCPRGIHCTTGTSSLRSKSFPDHEDLEGSLPHGCGECDTGPGGSNSHTSAGCSIFGHFVFWKGGGGVRVAWHFGRWAGPPSPLCGRGRPHQTLETRFNAQPP